MDDYAEIWVDGRLPRTLGQTGGSLVRGFNAPNRVVLTRDARPGQGIQLAIFAANAPLSDPPPNYLWIRSATLDFFKPAAPAATAVRVTRVDPAIASIVAPNARIVKLADGFLFTEGPVWVPEGYLLFSDPNANTIYRWSDDEGLSVFRTKSGYTGVDIGEYKQPGSNGLGLPASMVDLGGNIRVLGQAEAGTDWKIGVRNPLEKERVLGKISLPDGMAVATSGNYERFVEMSGRRYSHIIDPRTGYPVEGMAGVTVISMNATVADALSTGFFVLGIKSSREVLRKLPGTEVLFIPDRDPVEIWVTPGMAQLFSPLPEFTSSVRYF